MIIDCHYLNSVDTYPAMIGRVDEKETCHWVQEDRVYEAAGRTVCVGVSGASHNGRIRRYHRYEMVGTGEGVGHTGRRQRYCD